LNHSSYAAQNNLCDLGLRQAKLELLKNGPHFDALSWRIYRARPVKMETLRIAHADWTDFAMHVR